MDVTNSENGDIQQIEVSGSSNVPGTQTETTPGQPSGYTKNQKLTLLVIGMTYFLMSACYSILAPFFSEEATLKGVSPIVIGLIFGNFALITFIGSPLCGKYLNDIGTNFMLLSGALLCGGSSICFGFLDKIDDTVTYTVMCFVTRSVEASGAAMFFTSSFAIAAFMFPNNVATVLGLLEMVSGTGAMIGPLIGGALYEAGGFVLPFATMGSVIIINIPVMMCLLPKAQTDNSSNGKKGSIVKLLLLPDSIIPTLSILFVLVTVGFFDPTLGPFINQFTSSKLIIGLVFLSGPGLYGLISPFIGILADKGLTKPLMVIGNVVLGFAMLTLGPLPVLNVQPQMWTCVVAMVLTGIGCGCAAVPVYAAIFQAAIENGFEDNFDTHGLTSGIVNAAVALGELIGPVLFGGFVYKRIGFRWTASIMGFMGFIMACIMFLYYIIVHHMRKIQNRSSSKVRLSDTDDPRETSPLLPDTIP